MEVADFDYELPPERIAQEPAARREAARLLVDAGAGAVPRDRHVSDLPGLVGPGDVLVVNTTRVRPARVALRRATGGAAEALLLRPDAGGPGWWEALVRPDRKLVAGEVLEPVTPAAGAVEVGERLGGGRRLVRIVADDPEAFLDQAGQLPLPPYIVSPMADPARYQTVYARRATSAAAPTAGLHLTDGVLDRCRAAGAEVATVELDIGLATFRPMTTERVEDHVMHAEHYAVPEATLDACGSARRVVAVGTTTLRALEAAAGGPCRGETDLFITPGYRFSAVDVLMTNFHLPRSSLLVLVEAFVGPRWRELYRHALDAGYRFLSFGDAMWLERS